jgi:hypothetical protein
MKAVTRGIMVMCSGRSSPLVHSFAPVMDTD